MIRTIVAVTVRRECLSTLDSLELLLFQGFQVVVFVQLLLTLELQNIDRQAEVEIMFDFHPCLDWCSCIKTMVRTLSCREAVACKRHYVARCPNIVRHSWHHASRYMMVTAEMGDVIKWTND